VIVLRTKFWYAKIIEIADILRGKTPANHVAVFTHVDAAGTPWCVQGEPGGVGWQQAGDYLSDYRTLTNAGQTKTQDQRDTIRSAVVKLAGLRVPYDWAAIAEDALDEIFPRMQSLWHKGATGVVPGHVVCSSLAAWAYGAARLSSPADSGDWRWVMPSDWADFIEENHYDRESGV
jgi:hypothetical protein